jgi:hypothetical protein
VVALGAWREGRPMTTPTVTEMSLALEAVGHDPFIDDMDVATSPSETSSAGAEGDALADVGGRERPVIDGDLVRSSARVLAGRAAVAHYVPWRG